MTTAKHAMLTIKIHVNHLEKTLEYGGPSEICAAIDNVNSNLDNLRNLIAPATEECSDQLARSTWPKK
jgi:hypothetical protein